MVAPELKGSTCCCANGLLCLLNIWTVSPTFKLDLSIFVCNANSDTEVVGATAVRSIWLTVDVL